MYFFWNYDLLYDFGCDIGPQRKKTLLKEYEQSGKASLFVDNRIGEGNEELEEFDKAILRSQRERQVIALKCTLYYFAPPISQF